jgi:hypothetical protein
VGNKGYLYSGRLYFVYMGLHTYCDRWDLMLRSVNTSLKGEVPSSHWIGCRVRCGASLTGDKEKDLTCGHQARYWQFFLSSHTESLHYVKFQLSSLFYFTAFIFTCNQDCFSIVCVLGSKLESCFLPYWEADEVQCKEQLDDPRNWNMVIRT